MSDSKKKLKENFKRIKKIIMKLFKYYLIYVFIFAVLIFAIQKPKEKVENIAKEENAEAINLDRVALVESGEQATFTRLNLIANAQESIDISYYSMTEDLSTKIILGSVLDAADRGVKVRILLDGMFNDLNDIKYGFALHPNIEIKRYQPFKLLYPLSWNNRLHDKMIIADDNLALIGGRNIGDRFLNEEIMQDNFVKDRDVLIFRYESLARSSSVIKDMKDYYDMEWDHKYSVPSIPRLKERQTIKGAKSNENLKWEYYQFKQEHAEQVENIEWDKQTLAVDNIKFVHNPIGRTNQDPWCLKELLNLASEAEESIFLQSPYVIPSRNMKKEFEKYDIDLEKVTILTNSMASSPNIPGVAGYMNNRKTMKDQGITIYEYQGPQSIHSKTYVFDDNISVVGSFNLDARSSFLSTESMVVIEGESFAEEVKSNIEKDLANSLEVNQAYQYIEDSNVKTGYISVFSRIIIWIVSLFVFFFEFLL